jgi:uncharacterized protein (DUF2267 family)
MKKGCFLKIIIILTILIAAVLYVVENHFDDFIRKPGEKIIKDLVFKDVNREMEYVKNSPEKDSLKVMINSFIYNKIHKEHKLNTGEIENIVDSVQEVLKDSIISAAELENLKSIFKKELNERPKKD